MIFFFQKLNKDIIALEKSKEIDNSDIHKLQWLFGDAKIIDALEVNGNFVGPRKEMVTPWSTNAVEIVQNMGVDNIKRIEEFVYVLARNPSFDKMLKSLYNGLKQDIFFVDRKPDDIILIQNIEKYNADEGLALNNKEIEYLKSLESKLQRKLTDSEIYGFAQVNSEHCRHKIFNGTFIIDEKTRKISLFDLIKKTSKQNKNGIVSAYKDNVAFVKGSDIEQFTTEKQDESSYFKINKIKSVISIKAETHNFPTTVEPFNGASTGSGGEIRDRMAGGIGSIPMAGTAVYMTSYPRLDEEKKWEQNIPSRNWLYQTPQQILTKASNGASDFGNKFGQPLICGSLLTYEHIEDGTTYGFDKVIMLAGGIGYADSNHAQKNIPSKGDILVLLGGDNYRIGMGGGAVSSVNTGQFNNSIELNAVQRANPEMQKRVYNVIRALAELKNNPIISIHDHGAGGHLNCLSELVEKTGGIINIDKLPIGDPTLSLKEIIGNESQERMGLIVKAEDVPLLEKIAARERAPLYIIGEITDDHKLIFKDKNSNKTPFNLDVDDLFGNPPKLILEDKTVVKNWAPLIYDKAQLKNYIKSVLQLESVGCKDWLTNKVDRSVTGKIACQQTSGEIQLPLNNLGAVAVDFKGVKGIATALGHAPAAGLINAANGSVLSIAEALTNIVWAPLENGLKSVSLSANWMWPCKNAGEDARLYEAVKAASEFAIKLGINIPTGKDSLSMTQKYPDGKVVFSPGTVIITAVAEVSDVKKIVKPVLQNIPNSCVIYIEFSELDFDLGGSSFAQVLGQLGNKAPTINDANYFERAFETIQSLINSDKILAGHDISSGGLISSLFEMTFGNSNIGLDVNLDDFEEEDILKILFSEKPGVLIQVDDAKSVINTLLKSSINYSVIGHITNKNVLLINKGINTYLLDIDEHRDLWYKPSYHLDKFQSGEKLALERYNNYKKQPLSYIFPKSFDILKAVLPTKGKSLKAVAAIIREKGVNGDREMAYSLFYAGFDVKDIHITDLINGRENLEDVSMIVFVGGFSNSDVLGSAKGWAGAFLYNEKAKNSLENFYKRTDTLSLGVCNGCQLMIELNLINPEHNNKPKMALNPSNKFESGFINVTIPENNSVMFGSLSGSRLGVWVAHGEGRFMLPMDESKYNIVGKYSYKEYPGNPNNSDYQTAALASSDGRHIAMMPHIERSVFPWQWANYPSSTNNDEATPWIDGFVNARKWIVAKK